MGKTEYFEYLFPYVKHTVNINSINVRDVLDNMFPHFHIMQDIVELGQDAYDDYASRTVDKTLNLLIRNVGEKEK